jgi:hypothetical protein
VTSQICSRPQSPASSSTAQQEFFVDTGSKGTLTPDAGNLSFRKQTRYGSAKIQPKEFDGATLFVTESKANIREFLFDDLENAFRAQSVSFLAGDLVNNPVALGVQMEDTDQPEQYAFVVNTDGTLGVFFSIRNENIAAWTGWSTPGGTGTVKTVQDVSNRLFVITERTVNSATKLHLEYFDNAYSLDMNETVEVRSGNLGMGAFTLDGSGNLDLGTGNEVTAVEVGLDFVPTLTTLAPEFQLPDGVTVNEPRRVVKVTLDLVDTLYVQVSGNILHIRAVDDDFSLDPTAFTGRQEFYLTGWDKKGEVTITQDEPLDIVLNGVLVEVEI